MSDSQMPPRPRGSAILIASPDCLRTLHEQPFYRPSLAFTDRDIAQALEAIREEKASRVALERGFVESQRGQAFITQIKGDAALAGCAIETIDLRRVPRYRIEEKVDVLIHGTAAALLDVSETGAQVVSPSSLKPRQRVRVALREGERPVTGIVVWSQFELPRDGACYRAGIEFLSSAAGTLAAFLAKLTSDGDR